MPYKFYLATNPEYDLEAIKFKNELENHTGLKYPFLSLRTVIMIDGEPDGATLEFCKHAMYSEYCENLSQEAAPNNCAVTLMNRLGRTDTFSDGIKAILSINPYNSSVNVRTGRQYLFNSPLSKEQYDHAIEFLFDPLTQTVCIDAEENTCDLDETVAHGFNNASYKALSEFKEKLHLKIDIDDMMCIQNHFLAESRDPTYAEIAVIDRFFSEDFRHTTFETVLDQVNISNPDVQEVWENYKKKSKTKHFSIADIAETAKSLVKNDGITVIENKLRGIKVNDDYIVSYVGESKNRSVSAQPYDGAAGCLSEIEKMSLCRLGCISDSYRVSGTSSENNNNARAELASNGFNDYAYAVGLPCTRSTRLISSSYAERQLELCAAISVSRISDVEALFKKKAEDGDTVYLVGARTGRDGSVCFDESSSAGEFVPVTSPGIMNALNRLILREDIPELLNAVAYVGSGGIICAIGKLASGAVIHAEKIPVRHSGLSTEELLLSESAERMLLCVAQKDTKKIKDICHEENIPFAEIAEINNSGRMVVTSAKNPREVSIKTEFLLSGGTEKHRGATVVLPNPIPKSLPLSIAKLPLEKVNAFKRRFSKKVKPDIKNALVEAYRSVRFSSDTEMSITDKTVGGAVFGNPFSDKSSDSSVRYLSYMGQKIYREGNELCSVISLGTNPSISRADPFKGAYLAVTEAVTKAVVSGMGKERLYLALQEYLPEYKDNSKQYGMALASILGAYKAQKAFKLPSLGGRLSPARVGSQKENNVGVAAFTIAVTDQKNIITRDFKQIGSPVVIFKPETDLNGMPDITSQKEVYRMYTSLVSSGKVRAAVSVNARSAASGILEMCRISGVGFNFSKDRSLEDVFDNCYGAIIAELTPESSTPKGAKLLGKIAPDPIITYKRSAVDLEKVFSLSNITPNISQDTEPSEIYLGSGDLEASVNGQNFLWLGTPADYGNIQTHSLEEKRAIVPVNNCFSTAIRDICAQLERAGFSTKAVSYSESSYSELSRAIERADLIYIPDCLGNTAFAKAIFKLPEIKAALTSFREHGGLIYGEGNGFEILLSSGLLELDEKRIGVTKNPLGASMCRIGKVRTVSLLSPFMHFCEIGRSYDTVTSGKRLRICADADYLQELAFSGRIAMQYCQGFNLNLCTSNVEAITSADGRVLGRISHSGRLEENESFDAAPILKAMRGYFKKNKT